MKDVKAPVSPWWALAIAVCLILLPGLVLGPLPIIFAVLYVLAAFAVSFRSRFAPVRNQRLRNLAVYLFAAILAGAVHVKKIDNARTQGQELVSAIQSFHAERGRYPDNLEALVPKYIDRVGVAAYSRFFYSNDPQTGPSLFYVTVPPFGRRGYCFKGSSCVGKFGNSDATEGWYEFD